MKIAVALCVAAFALSGCASAKDVAEALAKDPATVCLSVTVAFPPFASMAKGCRTNAADRTATMDAAGNPSVVPINSK